jgi:hypothetical protein
MNRGRFDWAAVAESGEHKREERVVKPREERIRDGSDL